MSPERQLAAISRARHAQLERLYTLVTTASCPRSRPTASASSIVASLDADHRAPPWRRTSSAEVLPALTPLAIDVERPFPMLSGLSLNVAFWLSPAGGDGARRLAVVQVPSGLPRLVRLAGTDGATFVWLDDVIRAESAALFPGQTVVESTAFRLARDAELELDDEGGSRFSKRSSTRCGSADGTKPYGWTSRAPPPTMPCTTSSGCSRSHQMPCTEWLGPSTSVRSARWLISPDSPAFGSPPRCR